MSNNPESIRIAGLARAAIEKNLTEFKKACVEAKRKGMNTAEKAVQLFIKLASKVCLSERSVAPVAYSMAKEYENSLALSEKPASRKLSSNSSKADGYSTSKADRDRVKRQMASAPKKDLFGNSSKAATEREVFAYIHAKVSSGKKPSESALKADLIKLGYAKSQADLNRYVEYYKKVK